MGLGALRSIIRPVSRTLLSTRTTFALAPQRIAAISSPFPASELHFRHHLGSFHRNLPFNPSSSAFHSLTDTRYPKRRPSDKPHRKRAQLKPPGPYAWVKYVPGEPIAGKQPNEGSVKRRNEKKRIKLHRAFILAEKKKRKAQLQEAKRKKMIKRVERKMAAVARERAWAQRLVELQQIEEEKKATMA
ncbi:unnamed protein product [Coffea canephora]|uniref:Uncharacterized protein n=2 Tax=Coffea TaxID=13442 RepID=A0A068U0B5_COFCA|nr:uncharacterized protein LOC113698196 [Coffea arabica]CDP01956.1 unnamed protein product [Coffea canephora]